MQAVHSRRGGHLPQLLKTQTRGALKCLLTFFLIPQSECSRLGDAHQILDAFVLQTLGEGGGQGLHVEVVWAVLQALQLVQTVAEVVIGLAGHAHVSQGEVHAV